MVDRKDALVIPHTIKKRLALPPICRDGDLSSYNLSLNQRRLRRRNMRS